MILYQLECHDGHEFEAWFQNSAAYDEQAEAGAVECPFCQSDRVHKAIMAPHIAKRSTLPTPVDSAKQTVVRDARAAKWLRVAETLRDHVEKNFDYVGPDFPEQARRIHYGEAEERGIYGEASKEETEALQDEGIDVAPLPIVPKKTFN
jgi:hypothetical protein